MYKKNEKTKKKIINVNESEELIEGCQMIKCRRWGVLRNKKKM